MIDQFMVPYFSRRLIAFALMGLTIPLGLTAQDAEPVRWVLQPDETFNVELDQETGITTSIDTRGQQIGNRMRLFMSWKVLAVENEIATIEQVVDRITLRINSPSGGGIKTIELDTNVEKTQRKLAGRLQKQIQPLVGAIFKVKMSTRGQILDVEIPRETMDILRQAPSSMQLRQAISETGMKDWIGQSAVVFPETNVTPGDTWQAEVAMENAMGKIKKKNRYVYDGLVDQDGIRRHKITVDSSIDVAEDDARDATIESFSGNGTIWFAPDQSLVFDSQIENKMKTNRTYRDQTINSTVTTSVTMKVVRQ